MGVASAPDLLTLHAVRILGVADTCAVAERFGLDRAVADDLLLDFEANGWIRRSDFAGAGGWSLTGSGRDENERTLAAELDDSGARASVEAAYEEFLRLNRRLLEAVTNWQIRPVPGDPLAANDHTDLRWDDRVLDTLVSLSRRLRQVCEPLGSALDRFTGYDGRFAAAVEGVEEGERSWVDRTEVDSCHTVWFQLHEDLLATLGVDRSEAS